MSKTKTNKTKSAELKTRCYPKFKAKIERISEKNHIPVFKFYPQCYRDLYKFTGKLRKYICHMAIFLIHYPTPLPKIKFTIL